MLGSAEPGTKKVLETTYILQGWTTTHHVPKQIEHPWCLMKNCCWLGLAEPSYKGIAKRSTLELACVELEIMLMVLSPHTAPNPNSDPEHPPPPPRVPKCTPKCFMGWIEMPFFNYVLSWALQGHAPTCNFWIELGPNIR